MKWIEIILSFLRNGLTSQKIDMNRLIFNTPGVDIPLALQELDTLIQWNKNRKEWNARRIQAKLAGAGESTVPRGDFSVGDFGLDEDEVYELAAESDDDEEEHHDGGDIIELERKRRVRERDETSRRSEPVKPVVRELAKLVPVFVEALRADLSKEVVEKGS
jgi:hypothetical protein